MRWIEDVQIESLKQLQRGDSDFGKESIDKAGNEKPYFHAFGPCVVSFFLRSRPAANEAGAVTLIGRPPRGITQGRKDGVESPEG
jgi:hypothetical protein